MPGSYSFQLQDNIRLTWAGIANNLTGVTVTVINADDGSVLLSNQAMQGRGNGVYTYLWVHNRTVKTWCVANYFYPVVLGGTNTMTDYFTIMDSANMQLSETGKAY